MLSNLYFGSAWAFPGGGFEGAITGGFLAALQLNNDNIWSENGTEHFHDPRAMKLKAKKSIDENKMELIFDKPADLEFRSDQYVVFRLPHSIGMKLDLPYRWWPVKSSSESEVKFEAKLKENAFSEECKTMEIGEEALIFGPMT